MSINLIHIYKHIIMTINKLLGVYYSSKNLPIFYIPFNGGYLLRKQFQQVSIISVEVCNQFNTNIFNHILLVI